MRVELRRYRSQFGFIKFIVEREIGNHVEIGKAISLAAVSTGVPCIVCCYFVKEAFGDLPGLQEQTDMLIKFYRYTEITE